MLTRDAILSADDLKREVVQVPEWGGEIIISTMTGAARDAFEQSIVGGGKPDVSNIRARLVAACAVNEQGERIFSDADAELLGRKSAAALQRCAAVAQRLNAMTTDELEAARGN